VLGDKTTQLRGGAGLFAGRQPYVWISNLYGNTGIDYLNFRCTTAATSPHFVADPNAQPASCAGGSGQQALIVNTVDPNLKPPQVARYDLAIDRQLPLGLVATLEGIYSKTVHDLYYKDLALGLDSLGRTVEGRSRLQVNSHSGIGDAFDLNNTSLGSTYSLTGQLQRPFRDGWEASIAYTHGHAKDVNSLTSSVAQSNFQFNLVRFDPNNPELSISNYDIPDRVVANVSRRFNWFRQLPTDVTVVYIGQSGLPYSYAYNGDVNGDGFTQNDLIYVPKDASEIHFVGTATLSSAQAAQNFDNFINMVPCLRDQRGQVLERNSCRLPWNGRFDVKLEQAVSLMRSSAQLTFDIINFSNLLNANWGRQYFIANQSDLILQPTAAAANAQGRKTYNAFAGRVSPFGA